MEKIDWNQILGWTVEQLEDLRLLAFSYVKQGKYEISISIFEALLLLMPNQIYDLQTLGALYLEIGKNFQALHTLELALKVDPSHEPTLLNRTKALFALGYKRQAIAQAKELTQLANLTISNQASALLLAHS